MAEINEVTQGDEIDFNITLTDQTTIVTTATVIKFVAQSQNGVARAFEKSLGSGLTKVDGDEFTVTLDVGDTLSLDVGIYNIQGLIVDGGRSRAINFDPNFFELIRRLDFS